MRAKSSSAQWIGITLLFWTLVLRSEASPNNCNSCNAKLISATIGWRKMATLLAYNEILCWIGLLDKGCSSPPSEAFVSIRFKTSITRMKSMGERWSPCLSPLLCFILSPGMSLRRICVDEVVKRPQIKSHQREPNPNFLRTSKRKAQDTESKVLVMSSLRSILGCF